MNRVTLAELSSGLGALVLGLGLGALLAPWIGSGAASITVAGLLLHALGMWDKHRLERRDTSDRPAWAVALYWICWVALAAVLAVLIFRPG